MVGLVVMLVLGAAPGLVPDARHPLSVQDLLAMDYVSDPQPSPDGTHIAFVVSNAELAANRHRSGLWVVGADGSDPRRLAWHSSATDTSPRWAKDGRSIYYLSSRSGTSQVWRVDVGSGAAETVTELPLDVNAFALVPDGHRLVVSVDVFVDCEDLACSKRRLADVASRQATGRIYEHLFVRHWDEWNDLRRSHLLVVPIGDAGAARDLMKGMDCDAPSKPFGDAGEWTFTPDGQSLVFSARDASSSEAWSTNTDLFSVPLDGSTQPRRLTTNPAADIYPAFSPDGRTLAYLAQRRPGYDADRYRVVLRDWSSGTERVLTEAWDRSAGRPVWSADGKALCVTAEEAGEQPLFTIDVQSGAVRKLVATGAVKEVTSAGGHVVFTREDLHTPPEVCSIDRDGSNLRLLTHLNGARVRTIDEGEATPFTFKGWNEEAVRGWIVKPATFDARQRYPVALIIHGGPHASYTNEFHNRWNLQAFAGAGFGVVEIEFHGSTGYGQAFTDSIQGDRGGKPLTDLKRGLAAALERSPWMDGRRVCALGASYGGYLVNWIAGAWPDRFRCLVTHDGNFDERAAYFNTEELWNPEHDHQGTPWSNPDGYEKQNPVTLVKNWKTPMLVVQGGRDFRVVDSQGLSTFTALQRRGIPSKLLYFPDECHWVARPQNCVLWHETVIGWLKQWTSP